MSSKMIEACRLCGNRHLEPIIDLGNQPISSVFPGPDDPDPSLSPLVLVRCDTDSDRNACGLVQLKHQADMSEMYGKSYGYFSSISPTMVKHLKGIVDWVVGHVDLCDGDVVLDIGCNDGTLLNLYGRHRRLTRVGIDPSSEKFQSFFQDDISVIYDFFSEEKVRHVIGNRQCKVITSIAMFYDLENPLSFMKQIRSLLDRDGIWILELSYFPLLCTQLTYDQICHEHLTYFCLSHLLWMADRTDLTILAVSFNDVNGGSFRVMIGRNDGNQQPDSEKINHVLKYETPLSTPDPYRRLRNRVVNHREEVKQFFDLVQASGRKAYGYGASTKGNIVLNFCNLGRKELAAIGDRNPEKDGLTTPGTRIPIVAHKTVPKEHADYLFVLIWHLRKEVIRDEFDYLIGGGRLVFDLPRLHVVDKSNYERYLGSSFEDLAFSL